MSYPQEWFLQDKINAAVRDCAKAYEVHAISSHVDRLEHSLRETRALVDGLRDELSAAKGQIEALTEAASVMSELIRQISPSGGGKQGT